MIFCKTNQTDIAELKRNQKSFLKNNDNQNHKHIEDYINLKL